MFGLTAPLTGNNPAGMEAGRVKSGKPTGRHVYLGSADDKVLRAVLDEHLVKTNPED